MIEKAFVALLLGQPVLTDPARSAAQAAIQNLLGQNVFPQVGPQGAGWPQLIVRRTGGEHVKSMAGRVGIAKPRIAFDAYALDYRTAQTIIDQVGRMLDGYRGPAGPPAAPPAGFQVLGMFASDNPDGYEPPIRGDEQGAQAAGMEFNVICNE